jgi:hypothetical protein
MTGLEVLGAVGASLQLVGLATKAVKLFSDMSTGFVRRNSTDTYAWCEGSSNSSPT